MVNNLIATIKARLQEAGIEYELISLPVDLPPDIESHMQFHGHELKYAMPNMIFRTEKGLIVAQRRGDTQIDNKKLKELLGVQRLALAGPGDMEELGFKPGIVPALGYSIPVYMDNKVLENSEVYTGTGDKLFALKLNPHDLVKINNPTLGDFTTSKSEGIKRVFSGIQPSGNLHIGNYLGALKNWVDSQDEYENIFCIVDLHTITVPQDPKTLKQKIRELAAIYIASGIDPQKSTIFVQSHVSAHAELAWILNCFTPMGWLNRMTQFKEKAQKQKEATTAGLFDYPVLMAADILLYDTDAVPVGEDQKQHVEIARDIAQRFNSLFGETFKLPDYMAPKVGARVMGLDDPTKKMSKSEASKNHAINLLDSPEEIREKIASATTDSEREIRFDEKRPAVFNLLSIYQAFTGQDSQIIEAKFEGKGYKELKEQLAGVIIEGLKPIQEKYHQLSSDPAQLEAILKDGADKVRPIAENTLKKVQEKVGLG